MEANADWKMMARQIKRFSPDLHLLDHDDGVDMLAMHAWLKGRRHGLGTKAKRVQKHSTPLEALEMGLAEDSSGNSYFESINADDLTPAAEETLEKARELQEEERADDENSKVYWER